MLFESLSWVMLTLTLLVAVPGALASSSPKSKKKAPAKVKLQVYSAMEGGDFETSLPAAITNVTVSVPERTPKKKTATRVRVASDRVQTLGDPAPIEVPSAEPATRVASARSEADRSEYDVVPKEKRAQILKRMELCQALFEESGRAYDYRTMTTAQLRSELEAVRAGERPVAVRDSAGVRPSIEVPVDAVPAGAPESDPILDSQE